MVGNSDHKISAMNKNLKSLKNHRMNSFDHNSKSKLVWGYPICLYVLLNQTSLKVLRVTILFHGIKPITDTHDSKGTTFVKVKICKIML